MNRPEKTWKWDSYSKTWKGLTRESLSAFKVAEKAWIAEKLSEILTRRKAAFELVKVLVDSGYFHKKLARTDLSSAVMKFYNGASTPGEMHTTPEENWLKDEEEKARDTEREARIKAYRDKAVCWLIAKGKHYGEDFTADSAVSVAEEIAYHEEVARAKGPEGPVTFWHSFEGQNCDSCLGWDGVSHRCDCGNRRVSWVQGEGHTFETPSIHAEAY